MTWIATATHGRYELCNPSSTQVDYLAGLIALGRIERWTGQHPGFSHSARNMTVRDHSVHVYHACRSLGVRDRKVLRTALFHDFHEAFIGDVSRPMKQALRRIAGMKRSYLDELEDEHMRVVAERFDLIYPHPEVVRHADAMVLGWEADRLFGSGTSTRFRVPTTVDPPAINDESFHFWATELSTPGIPGWTP